MYNILFYMWVRYQTPKKQKKNIPFHLRTHEYNHTSTADTLQ